jgi:hypothetical protein
VSVHGPPRIYFEPRKLLNFDFSAVSDPSFYSSVDPDPDPAFYSNVDPDPISAAKNNADPDPQP